MVCFLPVAQDREKEEKQNCHSELRLSEDYKVTHTHTSLYLLQGVNYYLIYICSLDPDSLSASLLCS